MIVTVKLFARLRAAIGRGEIQIKVEGNRISDLIRQLAQDYRVRGILYDTEGNVAPMILVINNTETARTTEANTTYGGLDNELRDGDVVSILEQGCGA
ncbi:MoaD family protein [Candidatus Bathyarchaeota archaeon]|nr:MoaD family protein [Candidatus Bathyarchaeota archaeon]